jgi:hypothetical protein
VAYDALDGRHGGCFTPTSTDGSGRVCERASMGEMRQGRESGCGRGSKGSWARGQAMWPVFSVCALVRAICKEGGADRGPHGAAREREGME